MEFGHFQQAKNAEDETVALKEHDDSEAYASTVGNAFLDSINDGLYVAGRDDVDTRFWSTGLEDSGDYLFTHGNNQQASSITNRENYLESGFDIISLGIGINSIRDWDSSTSLLQKTLDVGGVTLDIIGLATPGLTFGASAGVKILAKADEASDAVSGLVKVANKVDGSTVKTEEAVYQAKKTNNASNGKKLYRYVDEIEVKVIRETGEIPNTKADLITQKDVFITDRNYKTAGRAKTHLQLGKKPSYKVEIDPKNVKDSTPMERINPSDNPQNGVGRGTQATTRYPIKIDIDQIKKIKGAN